jgi:hypothetical protein
MSISPLQNSLAPSPVPGPSTLTATPGLAALNCSATRAEIGSTVDDPETLTLPDRAAAVVVEAPPVEVVPPALVVVVAAAVVVVLSEPLLLQAAAARPSTRTRAVILEYLRGMLLSPPWRAELGRPRSFTDFIASNATEPL